MKHHRKFMPYIRRGNGRERTESMRLAFKLAEHKLSGRAYYVLVQRGYPDLAVLVGASKLEVSRQPLMVAAGRQTFTQWRRGFAKRARGPRKAMK